MRKMPFFDEKIMAFFEQGQCKVRVCICSAGIPNSVSLRITSWCLSNMWILLSFTQDTWIQSVWCSTKKFAFFQIGMVVLNHFTSCSCVKLQAVWKGMLI